MFGPGGPSREGYARDACPQGSCPVGCHWHGQGGQDILWQGEQLCGSGGLRSSVRPGGTGGDGGDESRDGWAPASELLFSTT